MTVVMPVLLKERGGVPSWCAWGCSTYAMPVVVPVPPKEGRRAPLCLYCW
eukprot:CAMPEP_0194575256 /NCGR_PEP_ID=MMETSP0292-20121207/10789_1 /TAXON_ID=39354 /ORGANISM="Heterosigma akashiwo, Strain CCMP2393" /LENGTH=49 /DNA_ID= /DNA_START= /DNA_END= /DNA_ORIENTATION=